MNSKVISCCLQGEGTWEEGPARVNRRFKGTKGMDRRRRRNYGFLQGRCTLRLGGMETSPYKAGKRGGIDRLWVRRQCQ